MWQVLCHCSQDVKRLMLWFKLYRTILYVTDVMSSQALMLLACYLSISSGELISTSSHTCGSWCLPIFLVRDGSFILISMASLMDLAKLWSFSALNAEAVGRYIITCGVMMVVDGWWNFHVFFVSFSKCSAWLPIVFIFIVHSATLESIHHPAFLADGISVLGFNKKVPYNTACLESAYVCYVCFTWFYSFHLNPWCMAPLCEVCWCCW